jgi:2-C-methyl-D-erythritol 4-phosphate cytidylyltransferase
VAGPAKITGAGPAHAVQTAFVVLAGGSGSRLGAEVNKVYLPLAGRRVISWSFEWARQLEQIVRFVLVVRAQDADLAHRTIEREVPGLTVDVVCGGSTRHDSERAALDHLAAWIARGDVAAVAVHDGARPLAGPSLVGTVLTAAAAVGGAVPALPAEGLLAVDAEGHPLPDGAGRQGAGRGLARVQTPQAFRAADLVAAYAAAARDGYQGTDTASSIQAYSPLAVRVVAGSRRNLKITYPHDLVLAERLLAAHGYRMP